MSPSAATRPEALAIDPVDLAALRGALVGELASQRSHLLDVQATVDDLTGHSDGDSAMAREMAERSIVHKLEVIAEVEHAIHSIADGTYGTCQRCNGPIALARLEIIPYARHCVSCAPAPPGLFS